MRLECTIDEYRDFHVSRTGPCGASYGLSVARAAGLPDAVLNAASAQLARLEGATDKVEKAHEATACKELVNLVTAVDAALQLEDDEQLLQRLSNLAADSAVERAAQGVH